MTEIWLAFIAGLAGSAHCIGMCGGIVAALAMSNRNMTPRFKLFSQLLYNAGRITTYTMLGIVAGMVGPSLDLLPVKSVAFWFSCLANVMVFLIGLASAAGSPWFNLAVLEKGSTGILAAPLKRLLSVSPLLAALPIGLILGLLPCGMVYAPLIVAAGSGSPLLGGGIMAALGLGTVPLLLFFGSVSNAMSGRVREWLFRVAGLTIALMGAAGLWRLLAVSSSVTGHHH
jgi:sulfite exporter TauE/SafE